MTVNRIKYYIKIALGKHPFVFPNKKMKIERYGSEYGGWEVILNSIHPDSIVYSIGIGNDISFDESLIESKGCKIYAYDPTPRVEEWINSKPRPLNFIFKSIGLGASDSFVDFYEPENPNHISHSLSPSSDKGFANSFKIPVQKLSTLMKGNNHTYIDIIKMDIEGFEYSVIENIISEKIKIKQLLVEYHHGYYKLKNEDTINSVKLLLSKGFHLVNISDTGREYTFVNSNFE